MLLLAFDMETSDPDDAMTLALLAGHPRVDLRAVTVTPGSDEQIGVVKHILKRLDRSDVLVGSHSPGSKPGAVSDFHYRWLGKVAPAEADDSAVNVLLHPLSMWVGQVTLLTGGPLKNPGALLQQHTRTHIGTWVAQGGFAGDSVVPAEHRLAKFTGRETCPTFNFNGAPKVALSMLSSPNIGKRWLVSKNVCHGVTYDLEMHLEVGRRTLSPGMKLVYEGMGVYLERRLEGKLFHDPLAAAVAIDREVCQFREVEVYRERGEWGSRLAAGTNTHISVSVNHERFLDVLTEA